MAVKFAGFGNSQFVIPTTGAPASGYKLYTYVAGSSTSVTTYTTSVGDVAQSNPIVLNSAGFPTTGQIWITEGTSIKIVFTDPDDVVIKTEDNIPGLNDTIAASADEWISGPTPTYIGATSFSLVGDQTSDFHVGRRVKTTNSGGTIYSTISATAYTTLTTVTVVNDSGTLDAGLSAVSYALLSAVNFAVPKLTQTNKRLIDLPGLADDNTFTGLLTISGKSTYWSKGADIASATSITLGTDGNYFDITGNTGPLATINCPAGMLFMLQFDSTPLLTHHATNLNLPFNGLDRQVAAGDKIIGFSTAANQVDVISYIKADGKALIGPLTSGTLTATTSGTSHDVTTIPAWVKRITIMFDRVSTNGTSIPLIQIGDSGGIETASYNNVSGYAQNGIVPSVAAVGTTGFAIGSAVNDAAHQIVGIATLSLMDSATNLWAFAFTGGDWNTPRILSCSGTKALSATLDRIRLTTVNGTDAFDNGSFNILYE